MLRIITMVTRIPLPLMIRAPLIVVWALTIAWEWTNWSRLRQAVLWGMTIAASLVVLGLTWLIGAAVYIFLHPVRALTARND